MCYIDFGNLNNDGSYQGIPTRNIQLAIRIGRRTKIGNQSFIYHHDLQSDAMQLYANLYLYG